MKRRSIPLLLALVLVAAACDQSTGPTATPPQPVLGDLIDRIGRPAIGSALVMPLSGETEHGAAVIAFKENAAAMTFDAGAKVVAMSLPLYDALDGACGNQLLAAPSSDAPARYARLAALAADDRLFVDTSSGRCDRYLAVEQGAAGDCGGRAPDLDVIDATYSYLALGQPTGVSDGVDGDPDGPPSRTAFPFLLPPK